jgi:predicted flavoprotein YhiN
VAVAEANRPGIAVIGGGPAGLMAAEVLAMAGQRVMLFDRMPSVGRKFLLAGKGGLNLTHAEDFGQYQRILLEHRLCQHHQYLKHHQFVVNLL